MNDKYFTKGQEVDFKQDVEGCGFIAEWDNNRQEAIIVRSMKDIGSGNAERWHTEARWSDKFKCTVVYAWKVWGLDE